MCEIENILSEGCFITEKNYNKKQFSRYIINIFCLNKKV